MRNKTILLAAFAFALVLGMSIAPAWAYFTDSTEAAGGMEIKVTPGTDIDESYDGKGTKTVVITNAEDATASAFVRVRVFSNPAAKISGTDWTQDGDWYVYNGEVAPGGSTSELSVEVVFPDVKSKDEVGKDFNVIVVYESIVATYNEDGTPKYDWSNAQDSGSDEGGN